MESRLLCAGSFPLGHSTAGKMRAAHARSGQAPAAGTAQWRHGGTAARRRGILCSRQGLWRDRCARGSASGVAAAISVVEANVAADLFVCPGAVVVIRTDHGGEMLPLRHILLILRGGHGATMLFLYLYF